MSRHADTTLPLGRALLLTLIFALVAGTVHAALFTVTMSNGTSFETRYRPVQADWDDSKVLVRTDTGNWIALTKSEIVGVESQLEATGYGYQLNTTTLFLGWTPNDAQGEDEEGADGEEQGKSGSGEKEEWSYDYGDGGGSGGSDYSFDQFLDIPISGRPLSGGVSLDADVDG